MLCTTFAQAQQGNYPVHIPETFDLKAFQKAVKEHDLVLVNFYTTWCNPCKDVDKVISQLEKKYKDKVKLMKIDVEEQVELATGLKIRNVPLVHIYTSGKLAWEKRGLVEKQLLEKQIAHFYERFAK